MRRQSSHRHWALRCGGHSDLRGIQHTGLPVRDLARSVACYRDPLGLRVLAEREARADYVGEVVGYPGATIRMAWLRHPDRGPILELLQYVDPAGTPVDTATPNPGTAHVAFSVPDIHATFERLRAAG